MSAAPVLYGHPFASYYWKAAIAFFEKDAAFDFRLLAPENPSAMQELRALWPLEKFPVLSVEGRTLIEASVIIEWLDLHRPQPRLIPQDPDAALEVRMLDRIFDNYVMGPMQAIVADRLRPADQRDPLGVAQAREGLAKAYAWLDGCLGGGWAVGDTFSLADCAAAPSLFYADWVQPVGEHPRLAAYLRRLRERPSVARAVDEARPYRPLFPGGVPANAD